MTYATLFKRLRSELRMNQMAFARALRVSQGRVSKLEAGQRPNADLFRRGARLAQRRASDKLFASWSDFFWGER